MVEQGDIDWATHAGDYAWMVGAVWDLDQAVRAIAAFVDRAGDDVTWDDTLVIVTADHANGHLRLGPSRGKGVLPAPGDGAYTWGDPAMNPVRSHERARDAGSAWRAGEGALLGSGGALVSRDPHRGRHADPRGDVAGDGDAGGRALNRPRRSRDVRLRRRVRVG